MALKRSSQPFEISALVTETGPNTYTQQKIDLQLNPLDNEILMVHAVDLQIDSPDAIAGINTSVSAALTKTSKTAIARIDQGDTIAASNHEIRAAGFVDGGVGFMNRSTADTPPADLDYVSIIATSDMFLQVIGGGNLAGKSARVRVYCTRAIADASTYAALVQSELLSN